jgi:hypothetical protein
MAFPYTVARLLGSDAYLIDSAVEYLFRFSPGIVFIGLTVALPKQCKLVSLLKKIYFCDPK